VKTDRQRRFVSLAAAGVVLVLAVLFAAKLLTTQQPASNDGPVPPDVLASVANVPATTFEQVGRGTAISLPVPVRADVRHGPSGLPL
jgi:hypothetical protein